ncbi:hypothetical protein L2E82_04404 [Cichorium intybus]|uniref:Uncharacterized protein n=1 Tax=Cichorium intybus TaxID=13427 RepID=A0ACB9H5C0_CICIN|nr:hypothetical protein L2E82_04404 [Cichorium intybus]
MTGIIVDKHNILQDSQYSQADLKNLNSILQDSLLVVVIMGLGRGGACIPSQLYEATAHHSHRTTASYFCLKATTAVENPKLRSTQTRIIHFPGMLITNNVQKVTNCGSGINDSLLSCSYCFGLTYC